MPGTAFSGAVITPFYDSLLVKVTARGLRFVDAARRMERCLQEFRVRGVKTNIPFLINLMTHPAFLGRRLTTRFIDETPELFQLPQRQDRATKLLTYIAEVIVNGHPEVGKDLAPRSPRRKATGRCSDLAAYAVPQGSATSSTNWAGEIRRVGPGPGPRC